MIKLPEWIKKTDITVCNDTTTAFEDTNFYIKQVWQRVIDWKHYPRDYFNLYESQGKLTLYYYKNNSLVSSQEILLSDQVFSDYVGQSPSLPINLILQGQDCEFRSLPTEKISVWDRFFLFNQLKTNEFQEDDLVNHYQPKQHTKKIDVLVAIRSNDFLKKVYKVLAELKNPISGVTSWDIEQSLAMKKQVSTTRGLHNWVVSLIPMKNHKFTMLVLCKDTIVLQRVVHSKTTNDIEKELRLTLRFLQRQGYKEGQPVTILVPEDTIELSEFSNEEFEAVAVSKRLFEKENYKPTKSFIDFIPKILKQKNLAYHLPRLAIKFLIPISAVLLIFWSTVQIKSFFQDYEFKWVNSNFEKVLKKTTGNFAKEANFSKLFTSYVLAANSNPSEMITNVNKLLKGRAQVLGIAWSTNEQGSELRLNFASTAKTKKKDFKKYINQNSERILGNAKIAWNEEGNNNTLIIQHNVQRKDGKNDN